MLHCSNFKRSMWCDITAPVSPDIPGRLITVTGLQQSSVKTDFSENRIRGHIYVSLTFFSKVIFFSARQHLLWSSLNLLMLTVPQPLDPQRRVVYFPVNLCFILFVFRITGAAGAHLSGHWAPFTHSYLQNLESRGPKLGFKPDPFSWEATVLHHHRGKVDCNGNVCRPSVYPSSGVSISIAGIK